MFNSLKNKSPWRCLPRRLLLSAFQFLLSLFHFLWPFSRGKRLTVSTRSIAQQAESEVTTETPSDWANLPDVCLLVIFDYLPTRQLLQLGSICRNWKTVQARACKSKRALTLLHGSDALKHLLECESRFTGNEETSAFARQVALSSVTLVDLRLVYLKRLRATFPAVTELTLSLTILTWAHSYLMPLLLDGYRSTLLSLKLVLYYSDHYFRENHYFFLIDSLNQLNSLKCLTVQCNCQLLPRYKVHFDLPILARLQAFSITTHDPASSLCDSFTKYALANDNLESIQVDNSLYELRDLTKYQQLDGQLLAKLKHMTLLLEEESNLGPCTSLFSRLTSLTYLELYCASPFHTLLPSLCTLRQLVHLKLDLELPVTELDLETFVEAGVLPMVNLKTLTLTPQVFGRLAEQLDVYHIGWSFPRLEQLNVHFIVVVNTEGEWWPPEEEGYPKVEQPMVMAKFCAATLYGPVRALKIPKKVVTFQFEMLRDDRRWTPVELDIEE